MISEAECAKYARIATAELPLSVDLEPKHRSLLESYRLNLKRGEQAVCKMIVGDFWRFMELGAKSRAADQFLVLRLFVSGCDSRECLL
jgi:hypothetical protein